MPRKNPAPPVTETVESAKLQGPEDLVEAPPPAAPTEPPASAAPPARPGASKSGKYIVTKAPNVISWMGMVSRLAVGSEVDASGYGGELGLDKLRGQGVELAPID